MGVYLCFLGFFLGVYLFFIFWFVSFVSSLALAVLLDTKNSFAILVRFATKALQVKASQGLERTKTGGVFDDSIPWLNVISLFPAIIQRGA